MEFMLSKGGSNFRFPVTPSEFAIQSGNMNQTVSVVRAGEVNLWGPQTLEGLTIESFFPAQDYNFCTYAGFPKPWECVRQIDDWRNSGEPLRIIIVDSKLDVDINMEVLVESFEKGMRDGTGDVYFTLVLRRYKRLNAPDATSRYEPTTNRSVPPGKTESSVTASASKANAVGSNSSSATPGSSHTVKAGETLWDIAKDRFGLGSKWPKVLELNSDVLKDPLGIKVGMSIKLPDMESTLKKTLDKVKVPNPEQEIKDAIKKQTDNWKL